MKAKAVSYTHLWQERDDFSQLQTSVGEVLAERCVKQPSELKSGK